MEEYIPKSTCIVRASAPIRWGPNTTSQWSNFVMSFFSKRFTCGADTVFYGQLHKEATFWNNIITMSGFMESIWCANIPYQGSLFVLKGWWPFEEDMRKNLIIFFVPNSWANLADFFEHKAIPQLAISNYNIAWNWCHNLVLMDLSTF